MAGYFETIGLLPACQNIFLKRNLDLSILSVVGSAVGVAPIGWDTNPGFGRLTVETM